MKVLHILGELCFSGAEVMLSSAAYILLADGPATALSTGDIPGPYADTLQENGYTVAHIPFSKSLSFFWKIFRLIRDDYDIVHIHTERASEIYAVLSRLAGARVVRSIHSEFLFSGALRWRKILGRNFSRLIGVKQIACSTRVARNERLRFKNTTLAIDNWIDSKRIQGPATPDVKLAIREKLGISPDEIMVLSIANDSPVKNLQCLFKAVEICTRDRKIKYFHCGAVSSANADIVAEMEGNAIKLLGSTANVSDYLYAADIFVCSSLHEGGPLVLMEAAISGLYCLTTRVGVAEEFAGQSNIVLMEHDMHSIADALAAAAELSNEERSSGAAAISRFALSRFVPEVGARRYLEVYREIAR